MFPIRSRCAALLAVSVLAAFCSVPADARAGDHSQNDAYPTDVCVSHKLRAAANYCREAVWAWDRGDPSQSVDERLAKARERLESKWAKAEEQSLAAGVSCEETTATSDEMIDVLDAGAADLAAAIATSEGAAQGQGNGQGHDNCDEPSGNDSCNNDDKGGKQGEHGQCDDGDHQERKCESRRNMLAAQACHHLLNAEATHLLYRDRDRDRSQLVWHRSGVNEHLAKQWETGAAKSCEGGPTGAEAVEYVGDAVHDALYVALVSPRVSSEWTMVTPNAEVPYEGKTLEPICSGGTPWVFFVKRGSVNKTLMYYQGGGACWDYTSCNLPTHKTTTGAGDDPANSSTGFADLSNPENPFRDWNAVFVPYCTGDVHWGDAVVAHANASGTKSVTIHHKGYVNAQVAEKWAREHFVNPDAVFVTGSSAGAYGAIVNSLPLQEHAWPSSQFDVLGDAGNGVITEDFLQNDISKWGVEQNLPDWIPALDVPLTELTAADLWTESALFYPSNRFGNYTTAYDGGQGGQVGFYNVMLNPGNPIAWLFWWPPTCEWNAIMRGLVQDSASQAENYRYYIGSGSRHTMWGNDKVYTDTTGGVPTIASWIRAMLDGTPAWTNVETSDPGLLLPGDPQPTSTPEEPYDTAAGRILCED
jgi:Pectinacetylesterase